MLEGAMDREIDEVLRFCDGVGLPMTFAEISRSPLTRDDLMNVATTATGPANFMDSMPFAVTPQMALDALLAADARGREFRAAKE
jgi:glycerol dehydrogenase